ncbi:MAG TPA: hypothetical protein DCO75_12560 [Fibrobacteres bacterium]|jgi:hypothetical protein|nr:hypothetical protein [Fibrobacterota bacterium]
MRLNNDLKIAAICGLFCGTCPQYPSNCEGCLSDKLAPLCKTCQNGFRECAKINNVTWCFECNNFPCQRLYDFKDKHFVNGISHHGNVINNLNYMKKVSVEDWIKIQKQENTCTKCNSYILWHEKDSHKCNNF